MVTMGEFETVRIAALVRQNVFLARVFQQWPEVDAYKEHRSISWSFSNCQDPEVVVFTEITK